MQIAFDLPDWALDRHIYILAGVELLAYKPSGENRLLIKTHRCNWCGWCCTNVPRRAVPRKQDGSCENLVKIGKTFECSLGIARPFHCNWSDPILTRFPDAEDHCSIRYHEIEF